METGMSPAPFSPPTGYDRIKIVHSFEELVGTPFGNGVNALCWQRTLEGDFDEVVKRLAVVDEITTVTDDQLEALAPDMSAAGRAAIAVLLEDQRRLRELGLAPILDCIQGYPRDEDEEGLSTDVYSFHADSATVMADTYLCSYNATSSEGLRNDQAQRHVDIPEKRAQLLKLYGDAEDEAGFQEFLSDHCYDLHYASAGDAQPFSFGIGNLWRIAVDYPGSPVPPCIHRAPVDVSGHVGRLLLIS